MANEFYTETGSPSTGSSGSSATIRAEFVAIRSAFDKMMGLAGNGGLPAFVNAGGTALEAANIATAQSRLGIIFSNELNGIANLNAVGLLARTANSSYASRTLTGPAAGIAVANGNGVSGNPTLSLTNDLNALEGLAGTGIAVRSANDTWAQRSVVGVVGISVANGDGVSNNVAISANLNAVNNSLAADVSINNNSLFFDGPSVAQGNNGTWFASGTVTIKDVPGASEIQAKLWDGTTVIASGDYVTAAGGQTFTLPLSGSLTSPSGNIRISVRNGNSASGAMRWNATGLQKDSTITAIRIS